MGKRKLAAIAAGVMLAIGLGACWSFGEAAVAPTPSDVAPAHPPARDLLIATTDGVTLAATYRPGRTGAPSVLLLHGNGASRVQVAETAEWLAHQGYATLAIDFRGHGQSSLRSHSFGWFESRDARAAVDALKRMHPGGKVAAIAISLGGAASLIGERGPLPVDAMVLQAVYPDIRHAIHNRIAAMAGALPAYAIEPLLSLQALPRFGAWPSQLSPLTALGKYRGSVMVIGGGADRFTPPEETRALFAAARGPRSLWIVDGLDHGQMSGLQTPEYRQRLAAFLAQSVGKP